MLKNCIETNRQIHDLLAWMEQKNNSRPFFEDERYCQNRDIFQARLGNLYDEVKNSLLIAILGEIGNNSFDHNLGSWRDVPGVIFWHLKKAKMIVLLDRGQGIRKTLGRVISDIASDSEAIKIACTKIISGRSPEQRGNGLKFVSLVARDNDWGMYLQSGTGAMQIDNRESSFFETERDLKGCFVVINYK